ncbi:MAG: thiamine pyrophosphate-binding protein [Flavobacteriaceae bacterium]
MSKKFITLPKAPTVGDLIIYYLKLEGITHVFGVPGGGLLHLLVNLKNNDKDIKYVICRQETGAAYMADGYYRATGKLGVVIVTTGPGATNALTGVMNAQADGSALLLITGEIDQKYDGMGYLQEGVDAGLDINEIYKAATSYSSSIDTGTDADVLMKQALRNTLSIPRQAAHLSLPVNVTVEALPSDLKLPAFTSMYRSQFHGVPIEETREAMKAILACKRPLIFLGNGCRAAMDDAKTYDDLLLFAESFAIPIMTTADAKGIFPESHELSLRVYGMADCMWPYYYLSDKSVPYDGILIIGSSMGDLSTNKWSDILLPSGTNAPFIQVDANQKVIARSFPVSQGIVAEAGAFIRCMASLIPEFPVDHKTEENRRKFIKNLKQKHAPFIDDTSYNSVSKPIEPAALMKALQSTMPKNTKIFIDAGNCVGWSVHYLCIDPPTSIYTSLSMGPMGFAVGAVVGAKAGSPKDTCIGFTGDGAFMMQGSEISTARQNKIGAIWIVLADNNLSMVSQGMTHFVPDKDKPKIWDQLYELGNPDLVKYSEGLGAEAYEVNAPDDFLKIMPTVLKRANQDGIPQVIIANINTQAVPPYYNPIYAAKT